MKFEEFTKKILNEQQNGYEFYLDKDKKVHVLEVTEHDILEPEAFQKWIQQRWPSHYQQIWKELVTNKKFSGVLPPQDIDMQGTVTKTIGD